MENSDSARLPMVEEVCTRMHTLSDPAGMGTDRTSGPTAADTASVSVHDEQSDTRTSTSPKNGVTDTDTLRLAAESTTGRTKSV